MEIPTAPPPALAPVRPPPAEPVRERCPNCDAERVGPYCQECGQHHLEGRITLQLLWRGFAERFLKMERGLFGTFRALMTRPGAVALEYVQGRRARYLNPLSYLFLGAALTLLTMPLFFGSDGSSFMDDGALSQAMDVGLAMRGVDVEDMDPARRAYLDAVMGEVMPLYLERMMETMRSLNSIFALVAALLLAGFFRLFFGGPPKGFTYAESSVATLYAVGHYYILTVPVALVSFALPNGMWIYTGLGLLAFGGYAIWTALGFYGRSWSNAALAAVSFIATYALFAVFVGVAGAALASLSISDEAKEITHRLSIEHGIHEHELGNEHEGSE